MSFKIQVLIEQHSTSSLHKCHSVTRVGYVFLSRRDGGAVRGGPLEVAQIPEWPWDVQWWEGRGNAERPSVREWYQPLSRGLSEHLQHGRKLCLLTPAPSPLPSPPSRREAHPLHSTALLGQGGSQQPEPASPRLSLSLRALLRVPWTRRDALMC